MEDFPILNSLHSASDSSPMRSLRRIVRSVRLRTHRSTQHYYYDAPPKWDPEGETAEDKGIIASKLEVEQEKPLLSDDTVEFEGVADDGSMISFRISHVTDGKAEARFLWRDGKNETYELAREDNCFVITDPNRFKSGEMTFEVLEPYRRWRFLFNGLVKYVHVNYFT